MKPRPSATSAMRTTAHRADWNACGLLTWIALRQRVPRGVRVPGVGSLFEEADRRRAFVLHAVAGAWLVAAAFAPALARSAGLAIALAYAVSLHGQWRCWRQAAMWRRDDG